MIILSKFNNDSYQRGAPRGKELAWWVARSLFFASWFPVSSSVKVKLLRLFGAQVGQGVVIRSRVNITMPWRLEIGDDVWIGDEVYILSLAPVTIGSNVCVSQRAFLCSGSHDFNKPSFDLVAEPIQVGDSSWICAQAFVGPGSTIPPATMVKAGMVWKKIAE